MRLIHFLRHSEWFRPLWWVVAVPSAFLLTSVCWLVLLTSRVRSEGTGADYRGPAVYVNWHRHLPLTMAIHGRARRWMMMLGAPYMAPIATWARCLGLHLIRGATGAGGREALDQLRGPLSRGESVVLAVDGPAGPAFTVKPGCIQLALATGVPIIPVAYISRRQRTVASRWDRMSLVFPFDDITVLFGAPIRVDKALPTDEVLLLVRQDLLALDPRGS